MNELTPRIVTMSSREIAALTGKRHDNVMADIRKMLEELGLSTPDFSGVVKVETGNGATREFQVFNLPRREVEILLTGYSVPLRAKCLDRLHELEASQQQAAGGEFSQGAFREFQFTRLELVKTVADMTEQSLRLAGLLGLRDNRGRFYADKLVKRQIGIGPIELLGLPSLPAAAADLCFSPQQLGARFNLSARAFNNLLMRGGFQCKAPAGETPAWRPTPRGEAHCAYEDSGRQHSDGAPVRVLRWKESLLDELRQAATELGGLLKPVARG